MLAAALSKPKYKKIIDKYFNQVADKEENLTALNTSFTKEGAYIYIPKSVVAEKLLNHSLLYRRAGRFYVTTAFSCGGRRKFTSANY